MYVESSAPRHQGDTAWMVSSQQTKTDPICMTFYYSMYGVDVGTLNVYVMTGNQLPTTAVWTQSGNQGNQWIKAQTSIQALVPYRVSSCFLVVCV